MCAVAYGTLCSSSPIAVTVTLLERREGEVSSAAAFLARVLQFMETPQYLRKCVIPLLMTVHTACIA